MTHRAEQIIASINWHELRQCYGSAELAPRLFAEAVGQNKERRSEAWNELFGMLCHQGTVYEASPAAVPVMVAFLADGSCPERAFAASMLVSLAHGSGYHTSHVGMASPIKGIDAELEAERSIVEATHAQLAHALHELIGLLNDVDVEVRRMIPEVFSALPGFAAEWMPEVTSRLGVEQVSIVRGALWLAIAEAGTVDASLIRAAQAALDAAPIESIPAAYALSRMAPDVANPKAAALARSAAFDGPHEDCVHEFIDASGLFGWIEQVTAEESGEDDA